VPRSARNPEDELSYLLQGRASYENSRVRRVWPLFSRIAAASVTTGGFHRSNSPVHASGEDRIGSTGRLHCGRSVSEYRCAPLTPASQLNHKWALSSTALVASLGHYPIVNSYKAQRAASLDSRNSGNRVRADWDLGCISRREGRGSPDRSLVVSLRGG
jgi:hypothetical protein